MPSKRIRSSPPPQVTGGGGTTVIEAFTDAFSLNIKAEDTNAEPTDNATFVLNLLQADSNADLTETVQLGISGPGFSDSNVVPTDTNSFTLRVWLSASAGTGSTNPANADGQNNGTVATLQTAVLGTNPIVMTSTLGANVPTATITAAIYRGWFSSSNTLVTSNGALIMQSIGALFGDITMYSNSGLGQSDNFLDGSFTFDLFAAGVNTLAEIQSCRMVHRVSDLAAGVTPHSMTVDAGCIEIVGAFS